MCPLLNQERQNKVGTGNPAIEKGECTMGRQESSNRDQGTVLETHAANRNRVVYNADTPLICKKNT